MPEPTLAELNAHLFASMLSKPRLASAAAKSSKSAKKTAEPTPSFTEAELAACAAAGVDASKQSAEELAAIVAAFNVGK